MNYLAHLYIADANHDSLIGHLLGDFVKGAPGPRYSESIRQAILFHRKIDSFTDAHAATRAARKRFDPYWRRFAGIMVDLCYDHFLARHWRRFNTETLAGFTHRVYAELKRTPVHLPERLALILPHMASHDWLGQYVHLQSVGTALDRIASRLTRGASFVGGIAQIKIHYEKMEKDFNAFFPDLILFARNYKQKQEERIGNGDV
jgi:acyl carrier protein phosphodiesterase